jgi:large subunit ribosomal protein L25
MSEQLVCKKREKFGKLNSRRLRRAGGLPAVLYGHGEDTLNLELTADAFGAALRHGERLLELTGDVKQTALIQDMQWDAFGQEVLHVDLIRVKKGERIEVEVSVETRGVAPGATEGGVLVQPVHSIMIETLATEIPDKLHLNVNELSLGDSLTAADIEDLPAGAKLLIESDTVLVECIEQQEEVEEEADAGSVEPEVIGRKDDEEGEGAG